ncbi:SLATT domain-containing protein [Aureimonas leprariae]|uniref:SLATT domain-containing protein n=2 Tax=Plantimonas leprariae TaxID=2615207 RepID=A0A7V7TYA5_9HYPH|nr:SLATT domain-containing protein [Aureimonas leprariae]
MKRTKGARFNASKRLETRDRKRTATTAYASAAVIILTLIPAFLPSPPFIVGAINLTTVAFSLLILASSLLQTSSADPVKADQFQRCALEINSLRRELRGLVDFDEGTVARYSARYDDILRSYNINHDDVDNEKYRLEHPDEFPAFTAEEDKSARRDVNKQKAAFELATSAIISLTAGIAAAAAAAASPFGERLVELVKRLLSQ